MESRKRMPVKLSAGQQWRRRCRGQACGYGRGRRGRDTSREQH